MVLVVLEKILYFVIHIMLTNICRMRIPIFINWALNFHDIFSLFQLLTVYQVFCKILLKCYHAGINFIACLHLHLNMQ